MSETKGLSYVDARLNEVQEWDGATSTVNPGEYHLQVDKVEGGQSQKGLPKMQISYKVIAAVGDLAEDNADMVGRTIVQSQSLDLSKDAVRSRIKSLVTALIGGADDRGGFEPAELVGAEMVAEVIAQTYSKANPLTEEPEERVSIKVIRERSLDAYYGDDVPEAADDASEPEPEPEPKRRAPQTSSKGRGRRTAPRA